MELNQLILLLISALGIISWFFFTNKLKDQDMAIKNIELDIKDLEGKMSSFKLNYLDRFQAINEAIHTGNSEIMEKIGDLRLLIEQNKH